MTKRRTAALLAWSATFLSCLFALGNWISARFVSSMVRFDPTVALTALTVVGLSWYTYFTYETLEHARGTAQEREKQEAEDLKRERESLATAVLAELRETSARLSALHTRGVTMNTADLLSHPMLSLAAAQPRMFSAKTVQSLTAALRLITDVRTLLEETPTIIANARARDSSPEQRQSAASLGHSLKTRAGWAFNRVAVLTNDLAKEGGITPAIVEERVVTANDSVQLLPDPFARPED